MQVESRDGDFRKCREGTALWHCPGSLPVIKPSGSHSWSLPWSWNDKEENNNVAAKVHMRKPGRRESSPYILATVPWKHMTLNAVLGKLLNWTLSCSSVPLPVLTSKTETENWKWEKDFIWDSPGEGYWTGCQEIRLLFPAPLFTILISHELL